ncbi:MAG TPA: hypothetical protein VF493_02440 [Terriglobales bacterium]
MTIFGGDPREWERLDWRLLQNGGVALYFRPAVLEEDVDWFRTNQYDAYDSVPNRGIPLQSCMTRDSTFPDDAVC